MQAWSCSKLKRVWWSESAGTMLKPDRRVERSASQDQLRHPVQVQHFNKRLELPRSSRPINFLETPIPYPPRSSANCSEPLGLPVPVPRNTKRRRARRFVQQQAARMRTRVRWRHLRQFVFFENGNIEWHHQPVEPTWTRVPSRFVDDVVACPALSIAISPPFLLFSSSSRSQNRFAFFLFLRGYVEHRSRGLDD